MAVILDDLRAAARSFLRRPLVSFVTVLLLAVGLGFNTALFAVVDAVLLKPLPYTQPDRIVMLWTGRNADGTGGVSSAGDFFLWQDSAKSFSALATYNISFGTMTGAGDPEELSGSIVSPDFFAVLGARPQLGRLLGPGDERIPVDAVRPIVISHSLWVRRFSADPGVIDRTFTFAGRSRRIVGVMAPAFEHPEPFWGATAEYWSPMIVVDEMRTAYGSRYLRVIGRLREGVSLEAARSEMDAIGRRLIATLPDTHSASVIVSPIADELAGAARPLAVVFLAATTLVLLLVVANVVNLLLARISHRRGEFAIRTALGAGRGRLASQVIAESAVLGLAGGLAGLLIAELGVRLVMAYGPGTLAGIEETRLDVRALLFALALAVLTGLLCGALPATRLARARLSGLLGGMRGSTGLEVSRRRTLIVAAETAMAVPLLTGAGLLAQTLVTLQHVDPGFNPAHAVQFRLNLPAGQYADGRQRIAFFDDLIARLGGVPGVVAVGAASSVPLGGLNNTGGSIVHERTDGSLAETGVGTRAVTSGYFAALGVPLRQGRVFSDAGADADVIVINQRAAETLWPGENPIGRRVRAGQLADPPADAEWRTVIGVVGDVRHEALGRAPHAEVFQPYRSNPWSTMTVVARTEEDPAAVSTTVRRLVREIDPALPVVNAGPVSAFIDGQLARPRFGAFCATVFGALGLVLSAAGTFAVLWLIVAQRAREIGIRMAFGATPGSVGALIVRQSMTPAIGGGLAGALIAAWVGRALDSVLVGVSARDPVMLAGSVSVVLVAALFASVLPAVRAMRMDPIAALRSD